MSTLVDQVAAARRLPAPRLAKAIRESAGVSQLRLAAELGVHRATVMRWEDGACRPRGEMLVRYAELLHDLQRVAA